MTSHRGEVYWVDLEPTRGSEQSGKRPAVIVSGSSINEVTRTRIVCPLTTKVYDKRLGRVHIPKTKGNGFKQDSDALVSQIRTVDVERLGKKLGQVTDAQIGAIVQTLNILLTY